jgi:phosphoenolpyruvate carboxylase
MNDARVHSENELRNDVRLLGDILGDTLAEHGGAPVLALVEGFRQDAIALRSGKLEGGREAFARRFAALDLAGLETVARAFTRYFHLINSAEEQHRIRSLRRRDVAGAPPEGSIASAFAELRAAATSADEVRALLARLFVMPVLTAHPTEARRRTVRQHLDQVSAGLERLDDPRPGAHERARTTEALREAVLALWCTEEARATRPTPLDEIDAGLHVFEHTLLEVTPLVYREVEDGLAAAYPGEAFSVGPFLRWGTWIGGDRDGNPNVTAEVTRAALERQRTVALTRHMRDAHELARELSVSTRRAEATPELLVSLEEDRNRLPEVAARARKAGAHEPIREKLRYVRARLEATRARADASYADSRAHQDDLRLVERSLEAAGLARLARGRLHDAIRRAEVFGFHLATLDIRQHSALHESAVAELLARGGVADYATMGEDARAALLSGLLERAHVGAPRDRAALSPATRELLATLDVVGRARRDMGAEACERYVVSFTSEPSDLLEVLFLARAAGLAPDEIRPVPLLEQLPDLEKAGSFASRALDLGPIKVALRGELEVMIGYSDSGKQAGYVASTVALRRAQEALAQVAQDRDVILTVFHGRGGAVGRGGGPANRAIRAQPPRALRGRFRVTEQGETIAARYARPEIARRDLEQMLHAVVVASTVEKAPPAPAEKAARDATLERAASTARAAYARLIEDEERLASYAVLATPIQEVAELPIASRPASRRVGLSFKDLRAIPWVFSWNQSRHGIPGWFGVGSALDAVVADEGIERLRGLYATWPFFRALLDNAQLALVRGDIDVASYYARLAGEDGRGIFSVIKAEHDRTVARILEVTGDKQLLEGWQTVARAVKRRNPYVDVLSHAQIELLGRLHGTTDTDERARIREILFTTINGIAAGLQTAG